MKMTLKNSTIAAAVLVLGTSAALADSQELYAQLAAGRRMAEQSRQATTIAVYPNQHSLGRRQVTRETGREQRLEVRNNARGQSFNIYVPAD